jgi:hypothetical protein
LVSHNGTPAMHKNKMENGKWKWKSKMENENEMNMNGNVKWKWLSMEMVWKIGKMPKYGVWGVV